MTPTAACCRALFFPSFPDPASFAQMVRREFFYAMKGNKVGIDNLRLAVMIRALPVRYEDWPEATRAAVPPETLGHSHRPSCPMLGQDGRCSIYDRRPYVCSDFVPSPAACGACSSGCSAPCAPAGKDAQ